jgi:hypothetical protein
MGCGCKKKVVVKQPTPKEGENKNEDNNKN